jgi:hypothetical protein
VVIGGGEVVIVIGVVMVVGVRERWAGGVVVVMREQGVGWSWSLAVVGTGMGWSWWSGMRKHGVLVVLRGRCGRWGVVSDEGAGVRWWWWW